MKASHPLFEATVVSVDTLNMERPVDNPNALLDIDGSMDQAPGAGHCWINPGTIHARMLSSQTMESKQPGPYFVGEVVDVTDWLGGYNFQWAWTGGFACAQGLAAKLKG